METDDGLRCPRCGMWYSDAPGWWRAGERCNDMSGWGGTLRIPCSGVLIPAGASRNVIVAK